DLLLFLDSFPVSHYLAGVLNLNRAKDMGVTPNEFAIDLLKNVSDGETALLARELCVQVDLKQQIAQFLGEMLQVVLLDCLDHLIRLFDDIARQAQMCLLAVPGASIGLAAQAHGDVAQAFGYAQGL